MPGKIFVNYRRGDDPGFTHALYQRLEAEFSSGDLFMDVEGHIAPGDDFVDVLNRQVSQSDVLLAVIGPRWTELMAARVGDENDFVAIELQAALQQGKRVIPVLVGSATMPRPDQLPEAVRALARRNAVALRPDRFRIDCQSLVGVLKEQLAAAFKERTERETQERQTAEEARRGAQRMAARLGREQAANAWSKIATSEDVEVLKAFLRDWPNSEQAALARKRIKELRRKQGHPNRRAREGLAALAALGALFIVSIFIRLPTVSNLAQAPSSSSTPTIPVPLVANTAWMLVSAVVTLVTSIPAIALFYNRLGNLKREARGFTHALAVFVVVATIWVLYGYSLSATEGGALNWMIGGLARVLLAGITWNSTVETFTQGVVIPEFTFIFSQMTIAYIATALIAGAMVGRIKFPVLLLFCALWLTLVYLPISHMFWYWAGPEATFVAGKALSSASGAAKVSAQAAMDAVSNNAGLAFWWGALDWAGGAVVYIPAGVTGLLCILIIPRRDAQEEEGLSENTMLVGALLFGIGSVGAIAGSALEASAAGFIALANVVPAVAAAVLAWLVCEWVFRSQITRMGFIWGALAGLVAITPAAGSTGLMGALMLGVAASASCKGVLALFVKSGSNPALKAFVICVIAGAVGMLGTGIVTAPWLGGMGIFDYASGSISDFYIIEQIIIQSKALALAAIWSAAGATALLLPLRAMRAMTSYE